jgi:IS605 OrfB family transposase
MSVRISPSATKGRLRKTAVVSTAARPKGEASALADSDQSRGTVSGVREADPVVEKALAAVRAKAEALGVELSGKLWVKPPRGNGSRYEVHAGKPKLGSITREEMIRCEVDDLFLLHRSVLLDIVAPRPEGVTWAEWSGSIRAIQWALGQMMDLAIDEVRLAERGTGSRAGKAANSIAYNVMTCDEEQDKLRAEAAKQLARMPNSARWRERSEFSISGATLSCASQRLLTQYTRWRAGEIGYPSWSGPNGAVFVRADAITFTDGEFTDKEGQKRPTFVCSMRIAGGNNPRHECSVRPNGDSARATLRRIIDGEYKHGDATLHWNDRKSRWQMQLSYTMPRQVPQHVREGVALAVCRNIDDLLFCMDNAGTSTFGDKVELRGMGLRIIAAKQAFARRKGELHTALNAQGRGARGHGKKRFFRVTTRLRDKEARTMDSLLKQLASHVRRAAQHVHAGVVVIEDVSDAWHPHSGDKRFERLLSRMPWVEAMTILQHELDEHGIRLCKVKVDRNAEPKCPACGTAATIVEGRTLDCPNEACGLLLGRGSVALAWQMFNDAGIAVDPTLARKESYRTRALRKKQAAALVAAE